MPYSRNKKFQHLLTRKLLELTGFLVNHQMVNIKYINAQELLKYWTIREGLVVTKKSSRLARTDSIWFEHNFKFAKFEK